MKEEVLYMITIHNKEGVRVGLEVGLDREQILERAKGIYSEYNIKLWFCVEEEDIPSGV